MTSRRRMTVTAAIACSLVLSSCTSLNFDELPSPGNSYSDGYDIVIEFANVLNLPMRAKVVMDGTKIGVVTDVAIAPDGVEVTSRINRDVSVPSNIHSVLQQATVLGDTYVALERAPDNNPAAPLPPGGRIPVGQTTSPPQIEDTIANLANFIGSGSIQRAQNTIIKVNQITPPRPEVRRMASTAATDLADLSNNVDTVDLWLKGLSESATVMYAHTNDFKYWLSPEGAVAFHHNFILMHFLAPLLPTLGTVYYNGYWLAPALTSIADAMDAIQHSKWALDEEIPRWEHLVTDYIVPERKYPAINITSIVGPDGRDLTNNVQDVLQMIGATP